MFALLFMDMQLRFYFLQICHITWIPILILALISLSQFENEFRVKDVIVRKEERDKKALRKKTDLIAIVETNRARNLSLL